MNRTRLVVAITDPNDITPVGPLQRGSHAVGADEDLAAACARADLLLTLADLDPATGGDYLAGWASAVVAILTAGGSSAERIQAAGEMIRLAGITQVSAVLIGADKADESIGLTSGPGAYRDAVLAEDGSGAGVGGMFTPVNGRRAADQADQT